MTPTSSSGRAPSAPDAARSANVAAEAAGKVEAQSSKATSRVFLVLRVALFVLACLFAVIGVKGLIDASTSQSTIREETVAAVQGQPVRHALILFSGDDSESAVAQERDGVLGALNASGVSSDVFYLGSFPRQLSGDSLVDEAAGLGGELSESDVRVDVISRKAEQSGGYDVVVAAGDDALSFVVSRQDLFGGIPLAFFAVSNENLAQNAQRDGVGTGAVEAGAASRSLAAAAALVPNADTAVIVVDGSLAAAGMLSQLEADPDAAPDVARQVLDASKLSRETLAARLSELDSSSFVLLLSAARDAQGDVFTSSETAYFVSDAAAVPVFTALGNVGEGVCGAAFIDRAAEGQEAAKLAIDLLNGVGITATAVTEVAPEGVVFDARALAAHGINVDATPDDAALINEQPLSSRSMRPLIVPILCMVAAIACIAGFGVIGFRRSMKSSQAIIASRNDLRYRLYHDLLTELPNRHALEQFAADSSKEPLMASLVQIDVNDFADINESYGHAFGNEVLKAVAQRLQGVKSSLLVRSGGDEFVLAFKRPLSPGCSELERIVRVFDDPVAIGDSKVDVSATVGVANREAGMTSEEMIAFADLATRDAKAGNIAEPVFYTTDMHDAMERKLQITAHLKSALADNGVYVLWQPQVDAATLEITGYEALCRLKGDAYRPADFIEVAEMSGLIVPLGRVVTEKVVEQMGSWIAAGRALGPASVNFSAAQLRDAGYCDFLTDLLAKHKVPASMIKIEITESMILGNEEAAAQLFARLRSMGVALALDDFGTGYSSLYRMAHYPIDVVKLDKSLVDAFLTPGKEGFISNVAALIHELDKEIIVEGVETYEQYLMCAEMGCETIQGFFFAQPLTPDEAIAVNPSQVVAEARSIAGDKTRNFDWRKYDRDERGRWTKKPTE